MGFNDTSFSFNTMQDFYGFVVNDIVHNEMINQLRLEFPLQIFSQFPQAGRSRIKSNV